MSHSIRPTMAIFGALLATLALGAALASSSAQGAALPLAPGLTDDLRPLKGPVPDRYIIVLKDSVERPGRVAERHSANRGAQVRHVYRSALKGYAARIPKGELAALKTDPAVAHVERDYYGGIASQQVPTGIDRVFATANEALAINEEDDLRVDANIAIIDTGVAEHPDLDLVSHVNCYGQPCAEGGTDGHGHGTHVAGTAAAIDDDDFGVVGVAPGARIWGVQVLSSGGFGELSEFIAGIDWVTATREDEDPENDIDVANSSLRYWGVEESKAFEQAIEASMEAGVVHVAAAGNESRTVVFVPGNHPDVITVSALADYDGQPGGKASATCESWGSDDKLASFSNYGSLIDVAAPGVCIRSTLPNSYGSLSGTSMASPHVAGAAGILAALDKPESAEDVEAIRDTIVEEGNFDWEDTSGDGIHEPLLDVSNEAVFNLAQNPIATTDSATDVTIDSATLNATVNPNGPETTYQFEYGKTTSYGSNVPAEPKGIGSGTEAVEVEEEIGALASGTTYHYRVVATNENGTAYGKDRTFETLEAPPTFDFSFGSKGSGNGQFSEYIYDVATDAEGNVHVLDSYHDRIQKFSPEGEYLSQIASPGSGGGSFYYPSAIEIDAEGDLWLLEKNNERVLRLSPEGDYLSQFEVSYENWEELDPGAISIDPAGDLWLARDDNVVEKFSQEGESLAEFGSYGSGDGEFKWARDLATDSEGNVWVADHGNHRIQKFNPEGEYLAQFGSKGTGHGQFEGPMGIDIDPKGDIWVADVGNNRVQKFNPQGEHLTQFGSFGTGDGEFKSPVGITLGAKGGIWIVDVGNSRVQRWTYGPVANTDTATEVSTAGATLNATVNPNGSATTYQFEYGKTTSYGSNVPAEPKGIGSGTEAVEVEEEIGALASGTTYHYRVVATNENGTAYGKDRTFETEEE